MEARRNLPPTDPEAEKIRLRSSSLLLWTREPYWDTCMTDMIARERLAEEMREGEVATKVMRGVDACGILDAFDCLGESVVVTHGELEHIAVDVSR